MSERRQGVLFGLTAYGTWGLFPLYWPLLEPASPVEILAHRCLWSLVVVAVALSLRRQWGWLRVLLADRRRLLTLAAAALAIAVNWGVYIYGVNSGQVVETALGYFVNPLVTVLLGMVVLHERLPRMQVLALGLAACAVAVLTVGYGRPPWIALVLAASFGTYGLLKKTVRTGALEGLGIESAVLALPALLTLLVLGGQGRGTFGVGAVHSLLLAAAGVVTAVPLLFFAGAASRVPLTLLGVMQYLTPTLQFLVGLFVRHEPLPPQRLAGFILIWAALALFTAAQFQAGVRDRRLRTAAAAEPVG